MRKSRSKQAHPPRQAKPPRRDEDKSNQYMLALFGAIVAPVMVGMVGWISGVLPNLITTSGDDPHRFSFVIDGRTISGESTNPFESARGYQARVEVCEKYGVENVLISVACYLTIKPSRNMTISNSRNPTTAVFQDGSVATICCMAIGDNPSSPLYRVELPPGAELRKTFRKGEDVHVYLNIPDASPGRTLDAITFSPGEGAATVLFPLRGNLKDRVFSAAYVKSRANDPRLQQLVREAIGFREDLKSREAMNRGLTYPN